MKRLITLALFFFLFKVTTSAQQFNKRAFDILHAAGASALAYAVVSADSVLECKTYGSPSYLASSIIDEQSRFKIGSNTKAITSQIAAMLVQQQKIQWSTNFFTIFPGLKAGSRKAYSTLTLEDLLSFRAPLPPFTYSNTEPATSQFQGDAATQRLQFAQWILLQPPQPTTGALYLTNAGYVLAGLMLEKVAQKPYAQLVKELNTIMQADFEIANDTRTVNGYGDEVNIDTATLRVKLNWLEAAGNLDVSVAGYTHFLQNQLKSFRSNNTIFTPSMMEYLYFGKGEFSLGWFWKVNNKGHKVAYNTGNPGKFLSQVYVVPGANRAYFIFINKQSNVALNSINNLLLQLIDQYGE
ncbi:CubicO group peptidase (beta-lactamase class C family) [Chitinophaga skermanii]|uniref:CubicO group peptidase (Beta-lactamase class C family) n=1 Tax=Chitinophaga skermanii TaxID=331697 RepID=A0A327QF69_9BACT|nr:serine hydrolase domain-containing protein [Chitinophaga skermanii]RAJ02635.1 CubicO group peptidase (beta-lactamase class C family) [Chitinophaga skermanii]